uniref:Component 2 n=1 Tax=Banana bunchy top virus TaxID=12585 RepID=Q65391_BBTV|nr:orf1 [Banana bunchy top virus]
MSSPSLKWCFTLNYSSAAERENFLSLLKEEDVHYAVVGDEVAPATGQKHLQGYLSLKKKMPRRIEEEVWLPCSLGDCQRNRRREFEVLFQRNPNPRIRVSCC